MLVWVSYVYSLLTHRRSDIPAASISAAAAAAAAANNAPSTPTASTPVSVSGNSPHCAVTPSFIGSPSPRKQLSFASSIAHSHANLDSVLSASVDAPALFVASPLPSSPNKPMHITATAAAGSSQPDFASMSRDLSCNFAARSPLRAASPAATSPQAQDSSSAWRLQSDGSSSNASSAAASPLFKVAAGRSLLINRDSVELASQRMHPSSSLSPSKHILASSPPPAAPVSAEDHLDGVYSPRNLSWRPTQEVPPVTSPSDGPLARALLHASPFKMHLPRSSGGSPASRLCGGDAAGVSSPSVDDIATIMARIKLQDSLTLSLNSPLREKQQQQQRAATAPSSSGQVQNLGSQREEASFFHLEQEHGDGQSEIDYDDNLSQNGPNDDDHCNGFRNGDGESQGQVWRLSVDSDWQNGEADADRPFTQSLGDADSGGSRNRFLRSSGGSASSRDLGSRVQVAHLQHS